MVLSLENGHTAVSHTRLSSPQLPTHIPARVIAMQASKIRRDATVSAEETGGFKYVPGGRELLVQIIISMAARRVEVELNVIAILKGTVNDATTFPEANKTHGSYHWAFERLLSAGLIPVMGAAAVSSGSAYVSDVEWDWFRFWVLCVLCVLCVLGR